MSEEPYWMTVVRKVREQEAKRDAQERARVLAATAVAEAARIVRIGPGLTLWEEHARAALRTALAHYEAVRR